MEECHARDLVVDGGKSQVMRADTGTGVNADMEWVRILYDGGNRLNFAALIAMDLSGANATG